MQNLDLYCLIMAGGKGTRFWPESTANNPKQYLSILSEKSLLTETCERFDGLVPTDKRFVVTVLAQKELCEKSTDKKINNKGMIFEPSGRNTGPCIMLSLASLIHKKISENSVVAIVPSDHVILNKDGFKETIINASKFASINQQIVAIGITPHFPHTGFGYIEKGKLLNGEAFKVSRFKEKPHFELAKEYVSSGNYLWNAGMFVAPIKVLLNEFKVHAPEMFKHFEALLKSLDNPTELKKVYDLIPENSFDYAIMEKSQCVSVIPANFDWNDLGSWDALKSVIPEKNMNTVVKSDGEIFLNSTDNIVYAPGKFVGLIDIDKHIVVVNDKVVLIAPIESSQQVKRIVETLQKERPELV
jgi:mannose-1-phosphate guanylyltransferase